MTNRFLDALSQVDKKKLHLLWATLDGVIYIQEDGSLAHRGRTGHDIPEEAVGYLKCSGVVSTYDYMGNQDPWTLSRNEIIKRGIVSMDWTEREEGLLDEIAPLKRLKASA